MTTLGRLPARNMAQMLLDDTGQWELAEHYAIVFPGFAVGALIWCLRLLYPL
jgi:hypothetical protein